MQIQKYSSKFYIRGQEVKSAGVGNRFFLGIAVCTRRYLTWDLRRWGIRDRELIRWLHIANLGVLN